MIKIINVSKVYGSQNNSQTAIDNLSLTLPSKGMIFVIGESGSGKSTLLNLIGGLDSITSGDIVIDGNNLTDLDDAELVNYRSSYIGFVFQDYSLIQDMNIYNNIKLSLDIIGEKDSSKVDSVLKSVNLDKFKTRHPNQLSGGQCQRAAIARAIVKNPKLILCDEPTGNLDSDNSKQVLDILKQLSQDRLIIVVSHNIYDARHYADRIIELKDGKVKSDLENDLNRRFLIENNVLYIDNVSKLEKEEIERINANLGSIKAIQPIKRLTKTAEVDEKEHKFDFVSSKFKHLLSNSFSFFKHGLVGLSLISLFSGALVATQGMARNLTKFEASTVIENSMVSNNEKTLIMQKAYKNNRDRVKSTYISKITDEDRNSLNSSKYKDEYYELINYSLPLSLSSDDLIRQKYPTVSSNLKDIYANESYGVLVTEIDYVKQVLGDFELLGGSLESQPSYGIYITDYLADSIMYHQTKYTSYSELIGQYSYGTSTVDTAAYISGIIKTGYKEKYGEVIETYQLAKEEGNLAILGELEEDVDYINLIKDITSTLGIGYSFNANFLTDCKNINARTFTRMDRAKLTGVILNKTQELKIPSASIHKASYCGVTIPERTLLVSRNAINKLLNSNYSYSELNLFMPLKANVASYSAVAQVRNDVNDLDYKLNISIRVRDTSYSVEEEKKYSYIASDDLFDIFQKHALFSYAFHFKNVNHTKGIYELLNDVPFVPTSPYATTAAEIGNTVEAYNTVFVLVSLLLIVIALALIVIFSALSINKHKKDIGILKALGAKDSDVMKIFFIQIGITAIVTALIATIFEITLSKAMDSILMTVIKRLMKTSFIPLSQIIKANPVVIILDVLMIIGFALVGAIIPFLMMKKIKPIQIIRNSK